MHLFPVDLLLGPRPTPLRTLPPLGWPSTPGWGQLGPEALEGLPAPRSPRRALEKPGLWALLPLSGSEFRPKLLAGRQHSVHVICWPGAELPQEG